MAREPVRFALFDWIDESGRDLGDTYEERLRVLELADRAGFYCFHLAEHHATELSTVPSPNVFLSAVAQRTRRLRLGALSYVLPLYDPVRLLEEICMLDQLSRGRLEVGLSRGSTGEHIDNDPEKARAMFNEALDVILMGLSMGEVDYHGTYFDFDHVISRLRPVQPQMPDDSTATRRSRSTGSQPTYTWPRPTPEHASRRGQRSSSSCTTSPTASFGADSRIDMPTGATSTTSSSAAASSSARQARCANSWRAMWSSQALIT